MRDVPLAAGLKNIKVLFIAGFGPIPALEMTRAAREAEESEPDRRREKRLQNRLAQRAANLL